MIEKAAEFMIKKPEKTRQQRRLSRTRQKLLDAARSLFAEKGLDLTTIDDITERADVGKGTFYYHFKNKEGLLKVLINEVLGGLIGRIKQEAEGITDLSELLDALIGIHIEFFSTRWENFVLYFQGRADLK
ncbi:MAG: helix-turn-helix domain-containing protein, partial [Candidatus Aminicenantaceae bacterium]